MILFKEYDEVYKFNLKYEPDYMKIFKKCINNKKYTRINHYNTRIREVVNITFEKIDQVFFIINTFIEKLNDKYFIKNCNLESEQVIDNYQELPKSENIELNSNDEIMSIDFYDNNILRDKLAFLFFNKINRTLTNNFGNKNTYGLTYNETIQFRKLMINLVNQIHSNLYLKSCN